MDDLAFVRERIESYADYTNVDCRTLSDEQIRAYLGEALACAAERLQPAGIAGETLARVLLRCQFADQRVIRALDGVLRPAAVIAIHRADRTLVSLADRAHSIESVMLAEFLTQVGTALDQRAEGIIAAAALAPPPSALEA